MQISEKLPQFTKKSLIIVTGGQSAEIYFVHKGMIDKLDSFKFENLKYSDNEGFFARGGKGMNFGYGGTLEENKQEFIHKFLKELRVLIDKNFKEKEPENIYVFSPDYMKNDLRDSLSKEMQSKIVLSLNGNFTEVHPFDLLKKIKREIDKKRPSIISETVKKILKKNR
ncbi:MAG: host attachment protein [Candidatus Nealsonbacteria bacterium]|nr:host attachment protein [Candidatus Nealsonbacteria bacterium]